MYPRFRFSQEKIIFSWIFPCIFYTAGRAYFCRPGFLFDLAFFLKNDFILLFFLLQSAPCRGIDSFWTITLVGCQLPSIVAVGIRGLWFIFDQLTELSVCMMTEIEENFHRIHWSLNFGISEQRFPPLLPAHTPRHRPLRFNSLKMNFPSIVWDGSYWIFTFNWWFLLQ